MLDLRLSWRNGQCFDGSSADVGITLDGDGSAGPSPVQTLAFALAGCMAIDVVHILDRMRTPLSSLDVHLTGVRATEDPRRLVSVAVNFEVGGDVPEKNVARAIALSRETYCSVWHSLRQDIELDTGFSIRPV